MLGNQKPSLSRETLEGSETKEVEHMLEDLKKLITCGNDERIQAQSSVIIACQNAILQKDERITELETERDKYNTIAAYRDWETDRKSTRLNSSHSAKSRMPSSA